MSTTDKTINDGSPAFPCPQDRISSGMSLRDWFAGQALAGMCAGFVNVIQQNRAEFIRDLIPTTLELADAMLKAREAEKPAGIPAWISIKVYHNTPEHTDLNRARFKPLSEMPSSLSTFEYDGHRWRYKHSSFDDAGDYDVIERPNDDTSAEVKP